MNRYEVTFMSGEQRQLLERNMLDVLTQLHSERKDITSIKKIERI